LIEAIETLRGSGKTLQPFEPPELNDVEEEVLAENELLDPEAVSREGLRERIGRWIKSI
jgi:phospholipase D1/2